MTTAPSDLPLPEAWRTWIEEQLESAPPLSPARHDRLAVLLREDPVPKPRTDAA